VKKTLPYLAAAAALVICLAGSTTAQDVINPTPFFANFHDTTFSSTINGELLPVGTIIRAYDPDGVLCGIDTVATTPGPGAFGFMPVYGDDLSNTPALDEGAVAGDTIRFFINGKRATVVSGNPVWADQSQRNVQLSVTTTIAMSLIAGPTPEAVAPGRTVAFEVEVRNDGDIDDLYGIKFTMTQPSGSDTLNHWQAIGPDHPVYSPSSGGAVVPFSVKAPYWPGDTVNTVSWTVYSLIDTTVTISGDVDVYCTVTDVDDPGILRPEGYALNQNYPNPFNPSTVISFELPRAALVNLDVYDILGRTVRSLDLGLLSHGAHEVTFDGSGLASGVYFYRVSTDQPGLSPLTKKMTLVK
jgi:hypothetical protein